MDNKLITEIINKLGKFWMPDLLFTLIIILVIEQCHYYDYFNLFNTKSGTVKAAFLLIVLLCLFHLFLLTSTYLIEKLKIFYTEKIHKRNRIKNKIHEIFLQKIKRQVGNKVYICSNYETQKTTLKLLINNKKYNFSIDEFRIMENNTEDLTKYLECLNQLSQWDILAFNNGFYKINKVALKELQILSKKGLI